LLDVKFQVLTAASMKKTAFWDIAPCSLIEVDGGRKDVSNAGQLLRGRWLSSGLYRRVVW
jgi:hypothetical protein